MIEHTFETGENNTVFSPEMAITRIGPFKSAKQAKQVADALTTAYAQGRRDLFQELWSAGTNPKDKA